MQSMPPTRSSAKSLQWLNNSFQNKKSNEGFTPWAISNNQIHKTTNIKIFLLKDIFEEFAL